MHLTHYPSKSYRIPPKKKFFTKIATFINFYLVSILQYGKLHPTTPVFTKLLWYVGLLSQQLSSVYFLIYSLFHGVSMTQRYIVPSNLTATIPATLTENLSHNLFAHAAFQKSQTADRRPQTADRRPQTADRY